MGYFISKCKEKPTNDEFETSFVHSQLNENDDDEFVVISDEESKQSKYVGLEILITNKPQKYPCDPIEKARGSMLGFFIGDAVGSPLEYMIKKEITNSVVNSAMLLQGGGILKMNPAQISYESEINLCILECLQKNKMNLPITDILRKATEWAEKINKNDLPQLYSDLIQQSNQCEDIEEYFGVVKNQKCENNSCLIRIIPLAIWGHKLSDEELYQAVQIYTMLTHSSQLSIEACYLYCYAIRQLLKGLGPLQAFNETKNQAQKRAESFKYYEIFNWFQNELIYNDPDELPQPHERPITNVKVSFIWAFYYLQKEFSIEKALEDILFRGGNTKANAAIVLGLLGAAYGVSNNDWVRKLEKYETPSEFSQEQQSQFLIKNSNLQKTIAEICKMAPAKLFVEIKDKVLGNQELQAFIQNNL